MKLYSREVVLSDFSRLFYEASFSFLVLSGVSGTLFRFRTFGCLRHWFGVISILLVVSGTHLVVGYLNSTTL